MVKVGVPPEIRFWRFVQKTSDCWLWTGQLDKGGYGVFVESNIKGHAKLIGAHRWAYRTALAELPRMLDHRCHTRACPGPVKCVHRRCVNPEHLKPTTHRENLLRGKTSPADNVLKTHCPQGHEYSLENTRMGKGRRGGRICRECARVRDKARTQGGVAPQNRLTCPRGHAYDGVNSQGRRICHECQRAAARRWKANH